MDCLFCTVPDSEKVYESNWWFARLDKFPVTEGHTLIIPRRHVAYVDDLTAFEWADLRKVIKEMFEGSDFNIGINRGALAGQTVFHVHVHVFPRTAGDVANPRGGIRNFKPALVPYE